MEPPSAPRSSGSQPQPNWSMTPPGPSAFAPPGPAIQPPGVGVSPSRVAFIQGLLFGLIAAGVFTILKVFFPDLGGFPELLILLIPYILAGTLASRRTGKTRTGVFTSFWLTFWYLLSSLLASLLVLRGVHFIPEAFSSVLLFTLVEGVGLGALGGLFGARLRQQGKQPGKGLSKQTIGTLYLISFVLQILPLLLLVNTLQDSEQTSVLYPTILFLLGIMALLAIPGTIAWIGALVNLARAQEWVWFFLVFLFSGIGMLIYLLAGPQPKRAGEALQAQMPAPAPPLTAPHGGPAYPPSAQAYPPAQPLSALDILQQRYARGEIDTATYDQMRARLEGRA